MGCKRSCGLIMTNLIFGKMTKEQFDALDDKW